jgi:hypothetical protein
MKLLSYKAGSSCVTVITIHIIFLVFLRRAELSLFILFQLSYMNDQ